MDGSDAGAPLFERPFWWAVLALALIAVPISGFLLESTMSWEQINTAINALLNATSAVFLVLGFRAIKSKNIELHKRCMLTAFTASAVFLVSYVARFYISGTHKYPGDGWDKYLYLGILFSHMVLAALVLPMVLRTLYLGLKDQRPKHRKIARITWPIWVYVSVTGLIVYLMLYPIASRLYGP
jgi:putative membrane protein